LVLRVNQDREIRKQKKQSKRREMIDNTREKRKKEAGMVYLSIYLSIYLRYLSLFLSILSQFRKAITN